jgi:NAD(P)-dependent dehydrogenase (short-subunit alcohol dehydrogenase family)
MADIRFDGKVAIVTGAGGGLGRQHALELARRGAKVVVNDLGGSVDGSGGSSEAAQKVVEEIKAFGGEAIAHGASVTDDAGVANMVQTAMDTWGRIDILIANAGILRDKTLTKMALEDFEAGHAGPRLGHLQADQGGLGHHEGPELRPHRRDHLVVGHVRQLRPVQLRRGQDGDPRSDEHPQAGGRQERREDQRHQPGRRHPHDRGPDAAGGAGQAGARNMSRRVSCTWPRTKPPPARS